MRLGRAIELICIVLVLVVGVMYFSGNKTLMKKKDQRTIAYEQWQERKQIWSRQQDQLMAVLEDQKEVSLEESLSP